MKRKRGVRFLVTSKDAQMMSDDDDDDDNDDDNDGDDDDEDDGDGDDNINYLIDHSLKGLSRDNEANNPNG